MLELIVLGTGGATATAGRDNTSFLIKTERERFLIDCPGGIIHKLKKVGEEPQEIASLFLTHIHPDHIYGLPSFVHSLQLEAKELFIYGSAETVAFAAKLLDLFELRQPRLKYRTSLLPLETGKEQDLPGGVKLKAIPTPHHSSSLAFRFTFPSSRESWLFSGDTPPHPPLWEEARSVDVLIHEASAPKRFFELYPQLRQVHTDAYELGRLAAQAQIPCLIPCHFFGEVDFSLQEIAAEVRANYGGRLIIPHDLERWTDLMIKKMA